MSLPGKGMSDVVIDGEETRRKGVSVPFRNSEVEGGGQSARIIVR